MVGIDSPRPRTSVVFWGSDNGPVKWRGGWDLNPRTPTGQGPEPCAFDLSWQPPHASERENPLLIIARVALSRVPARKIGLTSTMLTVELSLNKLFDWNTVF